MNTETMPVEDKKIYELTEVYEEKNGKNNQDVIVIDGRGYERVARDKEAVHDLVDIVGDNDNGNVISREEVIKTVREAAERVARELIPDIAEKIIREEIDKIKKTNDSDITGVS